MDATHLHLLINHVPIFATIFSVLILLWGLYRSDNSYQQLALVGFIIAGVFSIVALQSGEGAEEIVENLAGVSERFIHDHEEVAETANWIAILLAAVSFGGFAIKKYTPKLAKKYLTLLLVGGIISSGFFVYTAYLGGQIRHTEIRPDASAQRLDAGDENNLQETYNDKDNQISISQYEAVNYRIPQR